MNIEITERDIQKRTRQIQRLLGSLSQKTIAVKFSVNSKYAKTIGCHDGNDSGTHRDWIFKTKIKSCHANYFEIWQLIQNGNWCLECAYLQIYHKNNRTYKEVFSLHCDPNLKSDDPHYRYKRVPHLHIPLATEIAHAHIALDLNGGRLFNSPETLFDYFGECIEMIKSELLSAPESELA